MRIVACSRYPNLAWTKHAWYVLAGLGIVLLLAYGTYLYNWPAGVGAVAALYAGGWLALAFPAAREEFAAAWRDLRGYQVAVVILFLSCYVEGFFSGIALRASSALQESPEKNPST